MSDRPASRSVDWGHLVFLACIGVALIWYLYDAISVSTNIHNLLLVAPISALAIVLCLTIAPQCFRRLDDSEQREEGIVMMGSGALRSSDRRNLLLIGGVAGSLGCYVFLLNIIGFDIATWLFSLAVMLLCGERRIVALIIYPLLVAIVLVLTFRALLPYPMYTVVL